MQLFRDLRSTVDAEAVVIYLPDSFHDLLLSQAPAAGLSIDPVIVTAFRNT